MMNINPVGLAQERQRERDEKQTRVLSHRFDTITSRLDELEKRLDAIDGKRKKVVKAEVVEVASENS